MSIRILMITYNRPHYTQLSLERLCQTVSGNARITVWDNNSDSEMRQVLRRFEEHPAIERIIYNQTNERLWRPTNWFWTTHADADYLSKVDDDCLMPEGWCETLVKAHEDIPRAGVLGCWRFFPEDFDESLAGSKIQPFADHHIMRNCWVEGSGYMMKRAVVESIGLLRAGESFSRYCIRAAAEGFVNGWYYPFLFQEHMDDPRAEHTGIRTEEDFQKLVPLSARTFGVENREQWIDRLRRSARQLQQFSFDPADYLGVKTAVRRKVAGMLGKEYVPTVTGRQPAA